MNHYDPNIDPMPYGDPPPHMGIPRPMPNQQPRPPMRNVPLNSYLRCLVGSTLVLCVWGLWMLIDLALSAWVVGWDVPPFMRLVLTTTEFTMGVPVCGWALYAEHNS